jgi:magnesium-transporting ATPase (P-type)
MDRRRAGCREDGSGERAIASHGGDRSAPPTSETDAAVGLSAEVAARRLASDGPNRLPASKRVPAWRHLVGQLTHFFALMLWVAGVLAFVAGMPQLGVAIFIVIVINGCFAFFQEQRAERAAERLQELLPAGVTVRRDGRPTTIDASQVVVGDVVILAPGDRVPADLILEVADGVAVDASTLTGESIPVDRRVGDRALAGTYLTAGAGEGVVAATGADTELAAIARLTATERAPRTPLAHELDRIVRTIASIALGVGASFFVLSVLIGSSARDGFLFAVGVTVALVPEGLLPTVTLSLAMGAQHMAERNALVRRLDAVETLGSTTFICTDKTGTTTRNQMVVTTVWTPQGDITIDGSGYEPQGTAHGSAGALDAARTVAAAARTASQGRAVEEDGAWIAVGDPMEAAIDALAWRLDAVDPASDGTTSAGRRFAFDPDRRRESVVAGAELLVKGAPDSVIPRCSGVDRATTEAAVAALAGRGLRVLAVARRDATGIGEGMDADAAERDLELLGLIALHDPPRSGVSDAVRSARQAGLKLAMVTGDHPTTAAAIARQVGFFEGEGRIVQGVDLPEDEHVLGALLDHDGVVIARVSPSDKLRIARALQLRGHVVAMTGDGVNDGPALQAADIGVAMGDGGTDVARAAADLVLLDDDFSTIVAAIESGRTTFANIHRFLTYHLVDNVAELTPFVIWALSGGRFPLALGVLQILCLDIGTDVLPAVALGSEAPSPGILKRPPERRHLIDKPLAVRVFGVLGPTEAAIEMTAFLVALAAAGWRPGEPFPGGHALAAASGAAFAAVVLGQVGAAFACRSATRPAGALGWFTNRLMLGAVGFAIVLLVVLVTVPALARLLGQAMPPTAALPVILLAPAIILLVDRLHKAVRRRRPHPHAAVGATG